jgi:XRE family aerobic/anaerobic benzoate catabolism transcriptional regulator
MLRERAQTVWLRARPEVHWERVIAQGDQRPMANDPRAMERLRALWTEREASYRTADHVVDVSDVEVPTVVRELEKRIGEAKRPRGASRS